MVPTSTMGPAKRFLATRVMPTLVVLAGAAFFYLGLANVRSADESGAWPFVEGRVLRAAVREERAASGQRSGSGGTAAAAVTFRPVVVYAYTVGGTTFEGQRIAFGEYATASSVDADQVVKRYPSGTPVRVYYRPERPGEAVLEPGPGGVPWLFAALGGVFVLVGVLLAVAAPRLVGRTTA